MLIGPADRPVVLGAQYGDWIDPMILVVLGEDATLCATPGFGGVAGFGAAASASPPRSAIVEVVLDQGDLR